MSDNGGAGWLGNGFDPFGVRRSSGMSWLTRADAPPRGEKRDRHVLAIGCAEPVPIFAGGGCATHWNVDGRFRVSWWKGSIPSGSWKC
ncbi:MAG: hypothetical protein GY869_30535 [Planctomycetes bacterium]|nr:hypothetical protein [Planctomycetota bacterium]